MDYEEINNQGIIVSDGEIRENPRLVAADTIVICAGQESERGIADDLMKKGKTVHIIGGADVVELDAKRAVDQGVRLAIFIKIKRYLCIIKIVDTPIFFLDFSVRLLFLAKENQFPELIFYVGRYHSF